MIGPYELLLAFALDCAMGDPRWLPHPVRIMGKAVTVGERILRKISSGRTGSKSGGFLLAAGIVLSSFFAAHGAVVLLRIPTGGALSVIASALIIYLASTTLALRELLISVGGVFKAEGLAESRRRLSHIVGRDTEALDRKGVLRAATETLAENASDGIIAPLFYLALGGLPLAMAYKAANTLDSMVGYKNEKYKEFGWASARLDDAFNYIPARLTGVLIVASVCLLRGFREAGRSFGVMLKDGSKHASPNSGYPEAAMAGALGVVLGGPSAYGGRVVEKPFIHAAGGSDYQDKGGHAMRITALASALAVCAASGSLLWRFS